MTDQKEMEAALEAILFVSSEPVPRQRLFELFAEKEQEQAAEALKAVLARYPATEERGLMVDEAAGGLRIVTRAEMNPWLRRFFEITGAKKLSMGALETLAIIAYRQPVTAPEIQELRGVGSSGVLKTLLERRLVRIAGRKAVVGKPFLYSTTREFLVHFGLGTLKDLPPLEEFEEALSGESEALAETLPGIDREESILRQAAEIEDRASGGGGSEDSDSEDSFPEDSLPQDSLLEDSASEEDPDFEDQELEAGPPEEAGVFMPEEPAEEGAAGEGEDIDFEEPEAEDQPEATTEENGHE